ncbi:MAG: IclR family transcriptional regulator [Hyphomicrobiaceae bacterium]|nr:IclR family transcriptional regulator [Hyphomicrobiaceae bacterium]
MHIVQYPETPLARYARILEVLTSAPSGMSLTQVAQAANLQASTAHRLIGSLCDIGFLARQDDRRTYVVGPRLLRLCNLAVAPASVISMATPELHELVRRHSETAYLARLNGTVVESIAIATPAEGDRTFVQPGRVMPFHAAASAKAIFAFQDSRLINELLAGSHQRFTEDTRTAPAEILRDFETVRVEGIATCDNELDPGVLSFAVPVRGGDGRVVYAIGISGLSAGLREQPIADIRESLQRASRVLGAKLQQYSALDRNRLSRT